MLGAIKNLIQQKNDQLSMASVIFEDGSGNNLDDLIVLGEENTFHEPEAITEDDEGIGDVEEGVPDEPKEDKPEPKGDVMDDDIDAEDDQKPEAKPEPGPGDDHDVMNDEITGDGDIMDDQALPDVAGKQTGDPINPDSNIMDVDIDLGTNTIKDVLPVPPANASDAIADSDGKDSQKVDSGFGDIGDEELDDEFDEPGPKDKEECGDDLMSEDIDDYTEAITLGADNADGGSAGGNGGAEDGAVAPASGGDVNVSADDADGGSAGGAGAPADAGVENDVTSAIRDKVEDATSDTSGGTGSTSKDAVMKKLSSITKSIEDAKQSVLDAFK